MISGLNNSITTLISTDHKDMIFSDTSQVCVLGVECLSPLQNVNARFFKSFCLPTSNGDQLLTVKNGAVVGIGNANKQRMRSKLSVSHNQEW